MREHQLSHARRHGLELTLHGIEEINRIYEQQSGLREKVSEVWDRGVPDRTESLIHLLNQDASAQAGGKDDQGPRVLKL